MQLDNASGSVSFNNGLSSSWRHDPKIRSAYGPFQQQAKPYRSGDNWRHQQFPLLIVGYQNGVVKGNGHIGLSGSSSGDRFTLTSTDRARQVIPMTMSGKAMKRIYVRWMRLSTNTTHGLKLQLRRAGGSPGGSSDEGTLLFEGIIPASWVTQGDGSKSTNYLVNQTFVEAPAPIALDNGETCYLVALSAGSSTDYVFTSNRAI